MIVSSLLDTDLYKFTMMQAVLHRFPGAMVKYVFRCRDEDVDLTPYADEIREEINNLCQLRFKQDELDFLAGLSFIKRDFVEFLRIFSLNADFVQINTHNGFALEINGPWLHTIMFEVPVLAIISEVYLRRKYPELDFAEGRKRLQDKLHLLQQESQAKDFIFSDFGTRRRFSKQWQQEVIKVCVDSVPEHYSGCSNVLFAKKYGVRPIGTMAHEYLQACQALGPRLLYSQKFAFENWAQEYRGELGIALSDVYGLQPFLNDFDLYFCKLFDGARHDSGDPIKWGQAIVQHYRDHRIDPKQKTLVFSDGLDFPTALKIYHTFHHVTNPVFGIGTNLTNDMGVKPLNIVIKMVRCNEQPVAKISDAPGKTICDDESYITYLRQVFGI